MADKKLIAEIMPISKLQISEFNVRKEHDDADRINELAKSIQEQGVLQPLLVRPENGKYGIIIGSRRYSAAKKINLKDLPVTIKNLDDTQSLVVSLIENLQRDDLEPKETTEALSTLAQTMSVRELADKLGKSKSYVAQMVTVVHLVDKLEKAGTKVKMYPKKAECDTKKAIPIHHAIYVAEAFTKPQLKKLLEKEPDKDLEIAKAITHVTQDQARLVMDVFKKDPESNVEELVRQAELGLLYIDKPRLEFHSGIGDKNFDIAGYEYAINEHTAELCFNLTDIWHMPEPTDDVEVDFIRKSRDFRRTLVSELDPVRRSGIHSRLNYLSALIEEIMGEIEKVQK